MKTQVASASQQPPSAKVSAMPARKLQRKCACGSHSDSGEMCAECEGQKKLQRQTVGSTTPAVAPGIVHEVLRSPGQPLEGATRGFMESRFGHDFSTVRVHADTQAGESARAVDAHAFTVGRHVVFGTGQYSAETTSGKRLLAHELAHVVQQRSHGDVGTGDRLEIGPPHDRLEQEADALAVSTAEGRTFPAQSSAQSPSRLQRFSIGAFLSQIPVLGPLLSGRAFGAENYTEEELLNYYTNFVAKGRIENHYDSDNKARAIVKRLAGNQVTIQPEDGKPETKTLDVKQRSVLGREMCQGHVSGDDASQLLRLLTLAAATEVQALVAGIGEPCLNKQEKTRLFVTAAKKRQQTEPTLAAEPAEEQELPRLSADEARAEGAKFLQDAGFGMACGAPRKPDPDDGYDTREWKEDPERGFVITATVEPWLAIKHLVENVKKDVPGFDGKPVHWHFDCFESVTVLRIYTDWRTLDRKAFNQKYQPLEIGRGTEVRNEGDPVVNPQWEKPFKADGPNQAPYTSTEEKPAHPRPDVLEITVLKKIPAKKTWKQLLEAAPNGSQIIWTNEDAGKKCAKDGSLPYCSFVNENATKLAADSYYAKPFGTVNEQFIIEAMAKAVLDHEGKPTMKRDLQAYIKKNIFISALRHPKPTVST